MRWIASRESHDLRVPSLVVSLFAHSVGGSNAMPVAIHIGLAGRFNEEKLEHGLEAEQDALA